MTFIFPYKLGISSSQLTHIFQRGRAQPPTSLIVMYPFSMIHRGLLFSVASEVHQRWDVTKGTSPHVYIWLYNMIWFKIWYVWIYHIWWYNMIYIYIDIDIRTTSLYIYIYIFNRLRRVPPATMERATLQVANSPCRGPARTWLVLKASFLRRTQFLCKKVFVGKTVLKRRHRFYSDHVFNLN